MHRQREPRVEREDVVRHAGRNVLDRPETAAALLDDLEPDELKDVVAVRLRLGELGPRDGQLRPTRHVPVELHDEPAARPFPAGDRRGLAAGEKRSADGEQRLARTGVLDDERAVEAMGAADAADLDEVVRAHFGTTTR